MARNQVGKRELGLINRQRLASCNAADHLVGLAEPHSIILPSFLMDL